MKNKSLTRIAVLGASGYVGGQLLELLAAHPHVEITTATSVRYAGRQIGDVFPELAPLNGPTLTALDPEQIAENADMVLSALPHGASAEVLGQIHAAGTPVIDLSADYRFSDPALYESAYGQAHPCPELAAKSVYGLPEFARSDIAKADLVGVPGCYPTATLLALVPLLTGGFVKASAGVVVDAKSGISGAGREARTDSLYSEVAGGVRAYNVGGHRHQPEMRHHATRLGGTEVDLFFTPQVVPMSRGILASVYVRPADAFDMDLEAVHGHLVKTYADSPFAQVLPLGSFPNTRHVAGSNRFQVALAGSVEDRRLVAFTAIDNLIKGAAGQGIQCMNLMLGLPEETALPITGGVA
ncbi:MAG: N-acetyl-gamma-glutamyl-phosphate reductase [Leptospirillia bacterium]